MRYHDGGLEFIAQIRMISFRSEVFFVWEVKIWKCCTYSLVGLTSAYILHQQEVLAFWWRWIHEYPSRPWSLATQRWPPPFDRTGNTLHGSQKLLQLQVGNNGRERYRCGGRAVCWIWNRDGGWSLDGFNRHRSIGCCLSRWQSWNHCTGATGLHAGYLKLLRMPLT